MEIAFTKVVLPYGWLGNMAPFSVKHETGTYKTAEHLFQCLRLPLDHPGRQEIKDQKSPMAAKMVSKKYVEDFIVVPCSEEDVQNMLMVLRAKLKTNPHLAMLLKDSGNATIIEDCTKRQHGSGLFWGAARINGEWKGENVLGKLWMMIRNDLANQE